MKRLGLILLALLVFSSPAQAAEKIMFCRPDNMVSALAYIADAQGYFREEGLNITFLTVTNAKLCNDDLIAGKADVSAGGDGPFSYLSFSNHPVKLIAQTEENPETALFARRDKGVIHESDIKGKTVGYLPGTVSYLYLAYLLDKLGLSLGDLHLVALQPPAMPQALQGGVIDAFVMWEPWGDHALRALGDKAARLHDPTLYNYRGAIFVTMAFAQKHPEQVAALLRALLKAEQYIHDRPAASIAFLAEAIKYDPAVLEKNWSDYEFRVKLDTPLITLLDKNARFIQRDDPNFKEKPLPDFRKFIDSSFLKKVAPERVEKGM